ncbi:hypothetical protein [Rhodopseudomonas sp. RCAM05734]|uniref:hypothetical protein n=1 Tax=Rhodopseudomonas sp. RCAM05734 TaxID=3457549 RepID=UPI0040441521
MKRIALFLSVVAVMTSTLDASIAEAKGGNARATCLARAGVTEQQWQGRHASFAQGAVFKSCMAEHGQNVTVHKRDGSVLH